MAQANELMKTFADNQTDLSGSGAKMPPVGSLAGATATTASDGRGCRIWADTMEPLLTKLLATAQANYDWNSIRSYAVGLVVSNANDFRDSDTSRLGNIVEIF